MCRVLQHGAAQMSPSTFFHLCIYRCSIIKDALAVKVSRFKTVNEVNDVSPATRNGYLWRNTAHHCLVQRRDAATLLPIITAHTAPGTIIHSDEWAAYRRVQGLPTVAAHGVVNHSLHFVEPTTGVSHPAR